MSKRIYYGSIKAANQEVKILVLSIITWVVLVMLAAFIAVHFLLGW